MMRSAATEVCPGVSWRNEQESGGWGGIRTHGALAGAPVFKTGALNRSATHPDVAAPRQAGRAPAVANAAAPPAPDRTGLFYVAA
jgi:hypothetical protein